MQRDLQRVSSWIRIDFSTCLADLCFSNSWLGSARLPALCVKCFNCTQCMPCIQAARPFGACPDCHDAGFIRDHPPYGALCEELGIAVHHAAQASSDPVRSNNDIDTLCTDVSEEDDILTQADEDSALWPARKKQRSETSSNGSPPPVVMVTPIHIPSTVTAILTTPAQGEGAVLDFQASRNEEQAEGSAEVQQEEEQDVKPAGLTVLDIQASRNEEQAEGPAEVQQEEEQDVKPAGLTVLDIQASRNEEQAEGPAELQQEEEQDVKPAGLTAFQSIVWKARKTRIYGERYLIGRHDANGMRKLGGSPQSTWAKPKADHPRFQHVGDIDVLCFNDLWQGDKAPQWAGQERACVDYLDEALKKRKEFALFMRRSLTSFAANVKSGGKLLGWEYCGNYVYNGHEEMEEFGPSWDRATRFSLASKAKHAAALYDSSKSPIGYGRYQLDYWRERLSDELKRDPSPAGPQWLVEGRGPTDEETKAKPSSVAARGRALNFRENMSDQTLASLVVELDEVYLNYPIRFVQYDENIYNYIVGGRTSRDAFGHKVGIAGSGQPATAQAWYNFLDQMLY